jgi:polyhydroxybutyrate depolymerase
VALLAGACGTSPSAAGSPAAGAPAASSVATAGSPACSATTTTAAASPAAASGERTFQHDGETRSYLLAVPPDDDGVTPRPVIVDFHGFKASKELEETRTRLGARAPARGFVVVTPDALGEPSRWNTFADPAKADDLGFVDALLTDLGTRLCLDTGRFYAAGHSNGAEFASSLACRTADQFAALALVSSTTNGGCSATVAPAVVAVHGTNDIAVPYAGGIVSGSTTQVPAALDVVRQWAATYDCDPTPVEDSPIAGLDVERTIYTGCVGTADVALYTVVGGTHPWPTSPDALQDVRNSVAGRTFDATDVILDFFEFHQ